MTFKVTKTGRTVKTGARGRPKQLLADAEGNLFVWRRAGGRKWVSKWSPGKRFPPRFTGDAWVKGANGTRWALRRVANYRRCPYCREVRWLTFAVRYCVWGPGGVWSTHIKAADVRRNLAMIPILGKVPVKKCVCPLRWPGYAARMAEFSAKKPD